MIGVRRPLWEGRKALHKTIRVKRGIEPVLDYLAVFMVILGSHSMYYSMTDVSLHINELTIVVLAARCFLYIRCFRITYFRTFLYRFLIFAAIWTAYILIYAFVAGGSRKTLFLRFDITFLLLVAYMAMFAYDRPLSELFRMYANTITIIAAVSLVFWVVGPLGGILQPSGRINIYWGQARTVTNYYYMFFSWQHDAEILGNIIYRNIAIFTEAPMFSLHLSVAFMFDYLLLKRRGTLRMLLYAVSFLSAVSVTGILLVIMAVGADKLYVYLIEPMRRRTTRIGIIVVIPILIVALIVSANLLSDKIESSSGSSRMVDYMAGFFGWMENPWFGAGFGDTATRISYMTAERLAKAENGFSNSIMAVLCEGGVWFFLCYLFAFAHRVAAAVRAKKPELFIIALLWVYLFLTTTFAHTTLMLCFLASAFAEYYVIPGGVRRQRLAIRRRT